MTDDRIKRAAEWVTIEAWQKPDEHQASADAAHILSLLASGKAVLCEARITRVVYGVTLHAPLDPWSTT